jgi:GTP-binding protein EngB required for normal cell division
MEDKKITKESGYKIKVLETAKSKIPLRKCMKDGIMPPFPSSTIICGRSGSGKSNLMLNMLTRDDLCGNYYHYIVVMSPTAGKTDDLYKHLNIPDENFIEDFKPEFLEQLIESRKKEIEEKGIEIVAKKSRCLIILDDVIANREFLQSNECMKLFALLRHYLCSVMILIQSFTKVSRACRLNSNSIMIFPSCQNEVQILLDEVTPAGMKKRDFEKVIDYATAEPYNFLYINNKAKKGEHIRKNLDEIIDLEQYKTK